MQYAHDKQTSAEREQVFRHIARTSSEAWDNYREREQRFNHPVEYSTADKLTWWAMAERQFLPGLTTRVIPQSVPELNTFETEPVDVWTVNGRTR